MSLLSFCVQSSTIGRNKNLIPGEVIKALITGTEDVLAMLRDNGVSIHSTGGETADVGDLVRTIIVDSTVTCRMKRSDVIDNANIAAGDVIVGLSSYGQATYETEYNGGAFRLEHAFYCLVDADVGLWCARNGIERFDFGKA